MLNVQSINPSANSRCRWKLPYLKKQLAEKSENIPFIALTETWLKPYITDAMVDIEGYYVFRSDRSTRTSKDMMIGHVRRYCVHARYQILYFVLYIDDLSVLNKVTSHVFHSSVITVILSVTTLNLIFLVTSTFPE